MNIQSELVHKDEICAGDTILLGGELKTVCANNIKDNGFCGRTIFGDSFKLGLQLVERVYFVQKNGLPSSGSIINKEKIL